MTTNQKALNITTWIVAGLAISVGGFRIYQHATVQTNASRSEPTSVEDFRRLAEFGHRDGPPNALVTIVEFADFECPYCQQAHGVLKDLRREFPNDLAIVFRHFPVPRHQFAMTAAIASECAASAGQFAAFHDLLFLTPDSIGVKSWDQFGLEAGIHELDEFRACVRDSTTLALVQRDQRAAAELRVSGTPTFLINDLKIEGFPGRERLFEYVREALEAYE